MRFGVMSPQRGAAPGVDNDALVLSDLGIQDDVAQEPAVRREFVVEAARPVVGLAGGPVHALPAVALHLGQHEVDERLAHAVRADRGIDEEVLELADGRGGPGALVEEVVGHADDAAIDLGDRRVNRRRGVGDAGPHVSGDRLVGLAFVEAGIGIEELAPALVVPRFGGADRGGGHQRGAGCAATSVRYCFSFAFILASFSAPMRTSTFCPAEAASRSGSANSKSTCGETSFTGPLGSGASSRLSIASTRRSLK